MFQKPKQVSWWIAATIAAALLFVSASQEAFAGRNPLRVRVSDAIGTPGGSIVFVLRTYAPRPITQGQVYLKVRRKDSTAAAEATARATSGGSPIVPPMISVSPPMSPFSPPVDAVSPPVGPVSPPGGPVSPPISPISPPIRPISPPISPVSLPPERVSAVLPVAALVGSEAFSPVGDAASATSLSTTVTEQTVSLHVSSVSGTINEVEGPLAAMTLRLSDTALPGEEFSVSIDLNRSFFVDSVGDLVEIEPRDGTLTVRAAHDPLRVEVDGDRVWPGQTARLGMETFEPVAVSSGQVGFRFDPNMAAGPAVVTLDWRHGQSFFIVDQSTPGLVLVSFWSPDNSLNLVPGGIVSFEVPTASIVPPGSRFSISFDPSLTFLRDATGGQLPLPLDLINAELVFR